MQNDLPLTDWLRAAGGGDQGATWRAYALVYEELRRLAARQFGRDGQATLTPTALVSETFLKLAGGSLASLNDDRHCPTICTFGACVRWGLRDHPNLRADDAGSDERLL